MLTNLAGALLQSKAPRSSSRRDRRRWCHHHHSRSRKPLASCPREGRARLEQGRNGKRFPSHRNAMPDEAKSKTTDDHTGRRLPAGDGFLLTGANSPVLRCLTS